VGVDAGAAVLAGIRLALLDVVGTGVTGESWWTGAGEAATSGQGGAGGSIPAGRTGAQILRLAAITWGIESIMILGVLIFCWGIRNLTCIAIGTRTRVLLQGLQLTGASIVASHMVAGIWHRYFAQGLVEAQRTLAGDARPTVAKGHLTGAAILATHRIARISVFTVVADIV